MALWWERARLVMREKGITQDQLSAQLEMTQGGLQHWLSGTRQPSLAQIDQIAQLLGVPGPFLTHGVTDADLCTDLAEPGRSTIRRLITAQRAGRAPASLWSAIDNLLALAGLAEAPGALGAPIAPQHEQQLREAAEDAEREYQRQRPRRRATVG